MDILQIYAVVWATILVIGVLNGKTKVDGLIFLAFLSPIFLRVWGVL